MLQTVCKLCKMQERIWGFNWERRLKNYVKTLEQCCCFFLSQRKRIHLFHRGMLILVHVTCHGCIWPCESSIQMNQLFCMKNKLMQCICWMTMTLMVMMMMTNKNTMQFANIHQHTFRVNHENLDHITLQNARIFCAIYSSNCRTDDEKNYISDNHALYAIYTPLDVNLCWFFFSMKSFMCFGNGFFAHPNFVILLLWFLVWIFYLIHTPQIKWNIFFFVQFIVTH